MEKHMREVHAGTFTERQLPILLDICEQPSQLDEKTDCPLCPGVFTIDQLQSHLASHLEELALFVLPDDADNRSDAGSDKAELRDNEDRRLETEDLSGLDSFSDTQVDDKAVVREVKEFAKLLEERRVSSLPWQSLWEQGGDGKFRMTSGDSHQLIVMKDLTLEKSAYQPKEETFIVVMGQTGTGKTTFINNAIGAHLKVEHGTESCM
jgi:hypothetical protein